MNKSDTYKTYGIFSIGYGIAYIILDKIDYLIQVERDTGVLSSRYPEPIMLRIPNLIFSIALIIAGYFLIQKKKESWYLFNFSFIGTLLKLVFTFFLISPFAFGNILHSYGIHFIIALFGLVMINREKFRVDFKINPKKLIIKYSSIVLIALGISFLYGFENVIPKRRDSRKHFKELIYNSHLFSNKVVDSSHFAHNFMSIVDTLKEIDLYSQIQIIQIDSNSNPIYGERLSRYDTGILSDYYFYNDSGLLTKSIKEWNSYSGESATLFYSYYRNDKIKSIKSKYYFSNDLYSIETYNYIKNNDTVYHSDNRGFNYCYVSTIDDSNRVVETEQIKSKYLSSGIIKYEYNINGQLSKIIRHNQNQNRRKSIELFFYDNNGILSKKEMSSYKENTDKLVLKELTILVDKKPNPNKDVYN